MTATHRKSSRRAFFVRGGAVLGAGVATAMAASARSAENPASVEGQLQRAQDREAIRNLHLAFTAMLENQAYESAAELFDDGAHLQLSCAIAEGKAAIARFFADGYREQKANTLHTAYRPNASQQKDTLTISEDRMHASALYHVDVQVSTPLQPDCTAAQMARLQGQMADCRWETGRLEAKYVKTRGEWKIASLNYFAS